jgi:hypothetical protein
MIPDHQRRSRTSRPDAPHHPPFLPSFRPALTANSPYLSHHLLPIGSQLLRIRPQDRRYRPLDLLALSVFARNRPIVFAFFTTGSYSILLPSVEILSLQHCIVIETAAPDPPAAPFVLTTSRSDTAFQVCQKHHSDVISKHNMTRSLSNTASAVIRSVVFCLVLSWITTSVAQASCGDYLHTNRQATAVTSQATIPAGDIPDARFHNLPATDSASHIPQPRPCTGPECQQHRIPLTPDRTSSLQIRLPRDIVETALASVSRDCPDSTLATSSPATRQDGCPLQLLRPPQ